MDAVQQTRNDPVPLHLRNAVTGLMRGMGYGKGYRYSHDFAEDDPQRWTQAYLPDNVADREFYTPGTQGFEASEIAARWNAIRAMRQPPGADSAQTVRGVVPPEESAGSKPRGDMA
jgi:putative ATPase